MTTASSSPVIARLAAMIARWQQQLSSRVHVGGDAAAREHGWIVTETRGGFGFGGRVYRDPRFATRNAGRRAASAPAGRHTHRAR